MNKVLTMTAMLLTAVGAWAGDVTFNISPAGAGTVVASQAAAGENCTLTVTPAAGYYITAANLSAVTTLAGGGVQAPSYRAGSIEMGGEAVAISAVNAEADPSGITTYTFTMPADENVGVEVTAEFQTLIAISPKVSLVGWAYGDTPNAPQVEDNPGGGAVTFTYAAKGSTDFSAVVPENAGEYTVKAAVAASKQYAAGEATADFTITAAAVALTTAPAAIANLTYTGEAQALITAGEVTAGELQYSLAADGPYSTDIPTATDAGTYTVYYKVVADANYTLPEDASVEVSIAKATPELVASRESVKLDNSQASTTYANGLSIKLNGNTIRGTFTFTYESSDQNVATVNAKGEVQAVAIGEADIIVRGPINDANLNETEVTYHVSVYTTYGISIYKDGRSVTIDNTNRTDVFEDGTVKYDGKGMLVLNNAKLTGTVSSFILSSNTDLTIYLIGDNTIEGSGTSIFNARKNGTLTFTTEGNTPGTLTMKNNAEGTAKVISGFTNVVFEQNLAVMSGAADSDAMSIGTPIAPIVDETEETKTVNVAEVAASTETLSNITIDNVLYTLAEETDGTGDKVDETENCIILASTMIDDDVDQTVNTYQPGSDEFAEAFQGLTFMVPAGSGKVLVNAKTGPEGVLNVKIGDDEPYAIENALEFTDFELPYACAEATYVYVYNASRVSAPSSAKRRIGKKTSITVGVRTVGVVSVEKQPSNAANVTADMKDEEMMDGTDHDYEVLVNTSGTTASINDSRVIALPDNFFAAYAFMTSIDLRGTNITNVTVSRSEGIFNHVSKNTFIFVPAGNNTTEDNVVIGKICERTVLDANMKSNESFDPVAAFTAQRVTLDRTFKKDEMTTVYLPFAIDVVSAAGFGTFYSFDGVENGYVKLQEVTTTLQANTPYIFKAKEDGVQIYMRGAKVLAPDASNAPMLAPAGDGLYGCYEHVSTSAEGFYRLLPGEGMETVKFERMTSADVILPFQAYLKVSGITDEELKLTDDNSVVTGIRNVASGNEYQQEKWYTVSGVRLEQQPVSKGLYIRNGKKSVVK